MNREFLKREFLILFVLVVPIIFLVAVWNQLPKQLPIHWNIEGKVDNYGPKYLMAVLTIGLYVLLLILPRIDPRRKNYDIFSETYFKLRLILILFFGIINSIIIANAIGFEINVSRIIGISVLLLFVIIGNYLGNLRPNWFIGIRLPWTLESNVVWKKTHYLAGRLWFWLGIAALILSIFLPVNFLYPLIFSVVMVMAIVPVVYSYLIFKKERKPET